MNEDEDISIRTLIALFKSNELNKIKDILIKDLNLFYLKDKKWFDNTILHYAADIGWIESNKIIVILVDILKSNSEYLRVYSIINARNTYGQTPLMNACSFSKNNEYQYRIEALLSLTIFNIELNCYDKFGFTPLHYACNNGNIEIAKILIDYNCDTTIKNQKNKLALDYVTVSNKKYLQKYIDNIKIRVRRRYVFFFLVMYDLISDTNGVNYITNDINNEINKNDNKYKINLLLFHLREVLSNNCGYYTLHLLICLC